MFYTVYKGFFGSEPEVWSFDNEEEAMAFYNGIDIERYRDIKVGRNNCSLHKAHKTITCTVDGVETFIDEECSR